MSPYLAQYESDVVVRDGSTLRLRPVRPDDREALVAFFNRLSPESLRFRFFGMPARPDQEVSRLLGADYDNDFVLVAEAGGRVSGIATYARNRDKPDRADVAFATAEPLQGRGIGTRMLEVLAEIARDHHIHTFDAYVLQDNRRMMQVFLDSGFEIERRLEGGVFHVVLSLEPTPLYEAKAAARSQAAATASMKSFFEPRAVAVPGANRQRGKIGSEILHNLVAGGYTGRLAAVHPSATSIDGVPAYPRVTAIPHDVDLAVICVPRAQVSAVVDDCIAKGVRALVIFEAVGIQVASARMVSNEDDAVDAARAIGYPVALKVAGPEILHKSDVGGVVLDVRDDALLRSGYRTLQSRVGAQMTAAVVQQMIPGGIELLVGALVDPMFGPLVACGSGGVLVNVLGDIVFRLHPLTDRDAAEMLAGLKGAKLLRGYRGQPPADEHAVIDVLLRVSALLEICPEINELDINPLKALDRSAVAVDVRIRVGRQVASTPSRRIAY